MIVVVAVIAAALASACEVGSEPEVGEAEAAVQSSPSIGGPYGSAGTYRCTNKVPHGACYDPATEPLSTAATVLPYLDQAARNWGCQWNLGAHPVSPAPGGGNNFVKWYGSATDNASGCGAVWWNYEQQAAYFMPSTDTGVNVALGAVGATTYATSSYSAGTPTGSVIDGDRKGTGWGSGGGWSSSAYATPAAPQIITVKFNAVRTIDTIDVVTLQDDYGNPIEPTLATTFSSYGIENFAVQYYDGATWHTIANVAGNHHVLSRYTFAPVAATHVRLWITGAADGFARVVELSAYETSRTTASQILARYTQLGADASVLGMPISNPVPYGWNAVTYQLFSNGVITYKKGAPAAHFVGGVTPADPITGAPAFDDRPLAAAWQRTFNAYPTTAGAPAAYALTQDARCTSPASNPYAMTCGPSTAGRFVTYNDDWWGGTGFLMMRVGWTTAFNVSLPVAQEMTSGEAPTAPTPWLHALGYPLSDLENDEPTGKFQHQTFEHGVISWAPWYFANGAPGSCPATIATCTGAPGQVGCPVQYGARYTNYQVKQHETPMCAWSGAFDHDHIFESSADVAFAVAAGATEDYYLGSYPAGTTVQLGNCDAPERADGLQLTILANGVPLTATGACGNGAPGRVYATFSSRLGTEVFTARVSCPAQAVGGCMSTMRGTLDNDFNGDLIDVQAAYNAVPTASADASLIGLDDPYGLFTGPDYGCSCHDDHPEGIVRLTGNRFAITTDFGKPGDDNGILYLFKIRSKPVDDRSRLGTNIVNYTLSDADRLLNSNDGIGHGRGHMGGAARSGHYLLTASEQDNSDPHDGLIQVIDTTDDKLIQAGGYLNSVLFDNDGAAWATSAKLGTGSSNPFAANYIPPDLRNAHLVVSAGTNMQTLDFAVAKKDPVTGLSSLVPQGGQQWGDNFVKLATIPFSGGDNQASLITQADGTVFLMTLNADYDGVLSGVLGACQDSTNGNSHLYRLKFANCPSGAPVCLAATGGDGFFSRRTFETKQYVDFARAAGTYLVPTGSAATEKIIVYGLWATKVSTLDGTGCDSGDNGGSWLRAMEF